jgi:hypothetical protein
MRYRIEEYHPSSEGDPTAILFKPQMKRNLFSSWETIYRSMGGAWFNSKHDAISVIVDHAREQERLRNIKPAYSTYHKVQTSCQTSSKP